MGLILDSSIVIAAERRGWTVSRMLEAVVAAAGDQDAALSSIGLTELLHGLHRTQDPERRRVRQAFLDEVLRDLTVYPYTKETAVVAARVGAEQQMKGMTVPYADLLIGATALSVNFAVVTSNLRHFRSIPGLVVLPF